MSSRAALLVVLLLLAGASVPTAVAGAQSSESCTYPISRTDATGTDVTVEAPPERVVALGPSAAQTMWEIDAADQVVGMPVNQYTSYLTGYDERVNVVNEDDFTVNNEQVVNLTPDVVLASNIVPDDTVETLRDAGLTVYKFGFAADIDDVKEKTLLTGALTGNCETANDRVDRMDARLETVQQAVSGEERPRVIYPLGGGFVAGNGTFLHEIILTAGGRNVAAEAGIEGYGSMSIELIVTENPEWLVLNEGLPKSALQMYAYNHTTAIRDDQIVRVNPNYANQPAPRVVLAVETIAKALHPEAYAAANATATPSPSEVTATASTETTAEPEPGTSTPGQPGFGVLVGLVGLLTTVLARRALC